MLDTDMSADTVLNNLHKIEADFGRERAVRWGQRTLDLDLISMDDAVLPDIETYMTWRHLPLESQVTEVPEGLILPHPRLQERAFVLVPLAEVAPDWVHPIAGLSVTQMLDALPKSDRDAVVPIRGATSEGAL